MAFRSHTISEERAKGACKVLRWVREAAPRKKEKEEAASLLKLLEGIKGHRQVILTRGQEEMLAFILDEFPVVEPSQLFMFSPQEEILLSHPPVSRGPSEPIRPEQDLPEPSPGTIKPKLRGELTEEDREARRSIGLSSIPGEVPLDPTGKPLTKRIAEIQSETAAKERKFGKAGSGGN